MLVEKLHLFVIFNISFCNVLFISATNRVLYAYASGAPNENIVQNHINIALLNVL